MKRQEIEQDALDQIAGREKPEVARQSAFGWIEALGALLWMAVLAVAGLILWFIV